MSAAKIIKIAELDAEERVVIALRLAGNCNRNDGPNPLHEARLNVPGYGPRKSEDAPSQDPVKSAY